MMTKDTWIRAKVAKIYNYVQIKSKLVPKTLNLCLSYDFTVGTQWQYEKTFKLQEPR